MMVASRARRGGVIVNEHSLTAQETRQHIDLLSKWFEFIHHDDLPSRLESPARRPFCLLTFDDGKRSNATVTAPELVRLGVPAVFYVTTGFVGSDQPLWFDRYAALKRMRGSLAPELEINTLKRLPLELLEERLDRASHESGIEVDMTSDDVRPMSWEEIQNLVRLDFVVGAHGVRHTVLTCERRAVALDEIASSIRQVTANTGTVCRTFAFPNGNYTAELAFHALTCGATTVMTTEPTWAGGKSSLWRLPRIQLYGESSRARMELKLAVAASGRFLANPDGTGKAYVSVNRCSRKGAGAT